MLTAMRETPSDAEARLPEPVSYRALSGALGGLVLRPWLDGLAIKIIGDWIFPLDRGLAAALAAQGCREAFAAAIGVEELRKSRRIGRFLARRESLRRTYEAEVESWESAFFGPVDPGAPRLVAAETARRSAAQRLLTGGRALLALRRRLPSVRWELTGPEGLNADLRAWSAEPNGAYLPPHQPALETSRAVPGSCGREHWVRFPSPVLGDSAWARVYEPAEGPAGPTIIYLHGIAMEPEFWPDLEDPINALARRGFRVVRPEGPWHGRRRLSGWYGGEPALGRGPAAFIELFRAWAAEVAVLVQWARATSAGGPVGLAGVSLGALISQRVAAAAAHWPAEMRPDALLLIGTSGHILEAAFRGSLARAVGMPARLAIAGWSRERLEPLLPMLEPREPPAVAPQRIVMLLGRRDDVTPYEGGLELARRWGLPDANLFTRRQGHFSVYLGLGRDPRPLQRFAELLQAAT